MVGAKGDKGDKGEAGKDGVSVVNTYVNGELHLIVVLSDGKEIDAGYVGVVSTSHTVTFKDYDGTVLKTETVEDGKAATAPAEPERAGYIFTGWDKVFSYVKGDLIVTAQYQEILEPTIMIPNVTASAGDTVSIPVSFLKNPGIAASTFKISYDDSILILESVDFNTQFGGDFDALGTLNNPVSVSWSSMSDISTNGVFLTLNFKVKEGVPVNSKAAVTVIAQKGDFCNLNEDDVDFLISNGGGSVLVK